MNTPIPFVLALLLGSAAALAGSHDLSPRQALPVYAQECAACHTAYPPALLPAASWQRVMARLDNHYGTDASLDAAQVQAIGQWLQSQAGTYKKVRSAPPQDRISLSDWFVREHRKVAPELWRHHSVRSPAQCSACHTQADQGRFGERELRLPVR
ncbi:MAG: cytochrome C [Betaproteobacteria bacterium]|nr:cytochrome C [Betaproteobacteria bacterium]